MHSFPIHDSNLRFVSPITSPSSIHLFLETIIFQKALCIFMGGCKETEQDKKQSDGTLKPIPPPPVPKKDDSVCIRAGDFEELDVKILTLGAGECGKSTIWRQLKLVYCGGFDEQERTAMRSVIKINVIADIKTLIDALSRSGQSVATDLSNAVELVN
jgi:hypothetical protein